MEDGIGSIRCGHQCRVYDGATEMDVGVGLRVEERVITLNGKKPHSQQHIFCCCNVRVTFDKYDYNYYYDEEDGDH